MQLNDNEFFVMNSQIDDGKWILKDNTFSHIGSVSFGSNLLVSCELVSDVHGTNQSGMGQIAGGLIGMAVLGPLGALGGLMTGGRSKIDKTVVYCSLSDGRSFKANSTQTGFAMLRSIVQLNRDRIVSPSAVTDSSSGNTDSDGKECPNCAEIVKEKAKQCRFCGHSFEIGDTAIFTDRFVKWKNKIEQDYNTSFPADHVNKLYHILYAIDKIGSSICEEYKLEISCKYFLNSWKHYTKNKNLSITPNEYILEFHIHEIAELMNDYIQEDYDDDSPPEMIPDDVLIKTIGEAIAEIR